MSTPCLSNQDQQKVLSATSQGWVQSTSEHTRTPTETTGHVLSSTAFLNFPHEVTPISEGPCHILVEILNGTIVHFSREYNSYCKITEPQCCANLSNTCPVTARPLLNVGSLLAYLFWPFIVFFQEIDSSVVIKIHYSRCK